MIRNGPAAGGAIVFSTAILFSTLSACVPWTVRPIQDEDSAKTTDHPVTATAYADSIWESRLVSAILNSATDARTLLTALAASPEEAGRKYGHRESGGTWYFMVKGSGRVLSADTASRNGLLQVDIAPFDRKADVSIQIGPVLRGSALRDATGLIRFTDFANQLQFADVGNELNDRALKTVLNTLDVKALPGKMVEFAGAFALDGTGEPLIRGVVPVLLKDDGKP